MFSFKFVVRQIPPFAPEIKWCPRQDLNLLKISDSLENANGNAQIDAQILVALGRDLSQVVTAWAKLPAPLESSNPRNRQFSGGPAMILNPATVLNPVFNRSGRPDFRITAFIVTSCSSGCPWQLIAWVLSGGLRRKRPQGNSAMIISGIIITTRPPMHRPPPFIIADG